MRNGFWKRGEFDPTTVLVVAIILFWILDFKVGPKLYPTTLPVTAEYVTQDYAAAEAYAPHTPQYIYPNNY